MPIVPSGIMSGMGGEFWIGRRRICVCDGGVCVMEVCVYVRRVM